MKKSNVSYTSENKEFKEENFLVEYSEKEKLENEINAENAKLVSKIKYLTIPMEIFRLGLSGNEAILFAFMDSWLSEDKQRFYFTNEQLGELFNLSEVSISNILKRLKDKGLISLGYRKTYYGTYRFVHLATNKKFKLALKESLSGDIKKVYASIYNKNNINTDNKKERKLDYPYPYNRVEFNLDGTIKE